MGWKTKTIMVPKEVEYFEMSVAEVCDKIKEFYCTERKDAKVVIIHEHSWYDLKKEFESKLCTNTPIDGNNTLIQIMGIRVISSKDLERDAIEIY